MGETRSSETVPSAAEAAFLDYLARREQDATLDFEQFLRDHAGLRDPLRKLHDEWLGVARVAARLREDELAHTAGTARAAPATDDELHLGEGRAPHFELAGELLRRLAAQRAASGRYEMKGEIARGGMGVVHRIFDPILRRTLAMKVILARRREETAREREKSMERTLARFLEEAQVTSQLDHPGIVPVHELGIDATGRVYFTMRLVRGRDLRRIFELARAGEEGWTRERALQVLLKVCEAVAYAHDKGVIHRDLKPGNVMVGRFGEVIVMDWGLARVLGRQDLHDLRVRNEPLSMVDTELHRFGDTTPGSPLLTVDGNVLGTPQYMSPEQALHDVDAMGPASDVYSLGAILYELLAGHAPFAVPGTLQSPRSIWNRLVAGPPEPLPERAPDAPQELVAICDKAMARDPARRYANALELAADVEAWLHHRPVAAHAPSLLHLARLWYERNRTLARVAAGGLLLLAVVSGVFGWNSRREQIEIERLRRLRAAEALVAAAPRSFAPDPDALPEIDHWLLEVDELLPHEAAARERLAGARARGDAKEARQLEAPLAAMAALRAELRPAVARWRERLATLRWRSLEEPGARSSWDEALADLAADPRFEECEIEPRLGLVPLRKEESSGLWEFWLVLSGERPRLDPAAPSGYAIDGESALVLVLVPPGSVTISFPSQAEVPLTQVQKPIDHALDAPLWVSKFEVTQGQYLRVMGANPSQYVSGFVKREADGREHVFTLAHPVESVTWTESAEFCRRLGLELPKQRDWEYFARAGAAGAVWWHATPELTPGHRIDRPNDPALYAIVTGIAEHENVGDLDMSAIQGGTPMVLEHDGFPYHAPVGSKRGNAFGLFDLLGNVCEWCADEYATEGMTLIKRDLRGGHWLAALPPYVFLSRSYTDNPAVPLSVRGFRPVMGAGE